MTDEETELRRQIEQDREHIAETASAIAYKADVPARARENLRPLIVAAALALALALLVLAVRRG